MPRHRWRCEQAGHLRARQGASGVGVLINDGHCADYLRHIIRGDPGSDRRYEPGTGVAFHLGFGSDPTGQSQHLWSHPPMRSDIVVAATDDLALAAALAQDGILPAPRDGNLRLS